MLNGDAEKEKYPTVQLDYWSTFGLRLIDQMHLKTGTKVLDVGTGGAACLIPAAKKIGVSGQIIGIDSWEKGIPGAMENINNAGLTNASVQFMAAQEMTFEDNTFDSTVCGFIGFIDVYDFKHYKYKQENRKMTEMIRVLKKGGKAGFSTWAFQEDIEVLRGLVLKYLELKNGLLGKTKKIAPGYSKENTRGFEILMKDAGFCNIQIHTENYTIIYEDEVEWWAKMSRVASRVLNSSISLE
ncbi:MAG: class I SAM-dependent methyltransferase, partial [Candidatus Kariarchaeaceae archaeon]